MIRAFCDRCGKQIDEDVPGGVRFTFGKHEWSGHLCAEHQKELRGIVKDYCEVYPLRMVKGG